MQFPGETTYRFAPVAASVVVAVVASGVALGLFRRSRERETVFSQRMRVVGGVVLGLAVSAMHYTGMAAVQFRDLRPDAAFSGSGLLLSDGLAVGVGGGAVLLLGLVLMAARIDRWAEAGYAKELRVFEQVFRDSPVGIALLSAEGRLTEVNRTLEEMLGYGADELEQRSFAEFTHPEDVAVDEGLLEEVVAGEREQYQIEKRYRTKSGEAFWADLRVAALRSRQGDSAFAVGFVRDISDQKRLEENLRRQAFTDSLTGLPNRALLTDRVELALAQSRRYERAMGLLMLDVDHFKRINDRLGHTAGDHVLTELARRLEGALRGEDTVARWGGDEFVVVLTELAETSSVQEVRQRIRNAVRSPIEAGGEAVQVELTVGAVVQGDASDPRTVEARNAEELLRFASLALHWAKEDAPGGFSLFDPTEELEGAAQIRREGELRDAVERGEIIPHYQPIVRLRDHTLFGIEVLARWEHPERGLLSPSEFIPLAEELGLIGPLQETIIRQGSHDLASWVTGREAPPFAKIAFNISGQQFREPDLTESFRRCVDEAGCRPEQVVLEVTETSVMQGPGTIDDLRNAGFQVMIDDFGTGYSTFSYLRDLEIDGLKVDMSFVQGITGSESDAALVDTMLTLGERLDLVVIAEGIETEAQSVQLQSLGCELGQGYLFGRPVPAVELEQLVREASRPRI